MREEEAVAVAGRRGGFVAAVLGQDAADRRGSLLSPLISPTASHDDAGSWMQRICYSGTDEPRTGVRSHRTPSLLVSSC